MSEMVERLAKLMYQRHGQRQFPTMAFDGEASWAVEEDETREWFRSNVRCVIEAFREPTDYMVRCGDTSIVWQLFVAGVDVRVFANRENEVTRPVFREMIETALR